MSTTSNKRTPRSDNKSNTPGAKRRYKSMQITRNLKPQTNRRRYRYRVPKHQQRLLQVARLQNDVKNLVPKAEDLEKAFQNAADYEEVGDGLIEDFKYFILKHTDDDRTLAITSDGNNVQSAIPEMYIDTIVEKVYQELGIKTSPEFDLQTFVTQVCKTVFAHKTLTQRIRTFVKNND